MSRDARGRSLEGLTLACALILPATLFLALGAPPAAAAGPEWRIDTPQTLDNQTYLADGPITIGQGGVLTVRHSTILFNLTAEGSLALTVHAGGSLILEDAALRSGVEGWHYNFLVSGHLEARRADISDLRGDAGLGGLEIDGGNAVIEDSSIHHNRYYGLFLRSGAPVIRRTTFDANVVAISVLPGASPVLEDLVIRNSTSIGLKIDDASPVVRNLTVTGSSNFAVGARSAVLDIVGCRLSGGVVGLDAVNGTTGRVQGCEFLSLGTGVRAQDSPLAVSNSTFFSDGIGVNATRSAVEVASNEFTDVGVGVRVQEPVAGVLGGAAVDNQFAGIGTGIELYASNFFLSDNTYGPLMTGTRVFHAVQLLIIDKAGAPVARARVNITAANGALVFAGLTNDTGAVTATLEEFREFGNGTRLNLTPHGVRIESPGLVTETTVNATADKTERITLAEPPAATTVLGVSREALLLVAAVLGAAALVAGLSLRARRRRQSADLERRSGARRRRGPRAGR